MTTRAAARGPRAPDSGPRPVFCVVEREHRDLAIAAAARAGRFTHAGVTVDLGLEPDWSHPDLPADREWLIEWGKFSWGLDMAYAAGVTGNPGFLRSWRRTVRGWIHGQRPGEDPTHTVGRRIQNWLYAWTSFAQSPDFTGLGEDLATQIADSLEDQATTLRTRLSPVRNHRTVELYALFLFALAMPDRAGDGELLDFAVTELHHNLLADVRPDGVHCEASTHYHLIALRSWLGARENARRFGVPMPEGYDERLHAACEFGLHVHRPDGQIPAISDSDAGSYADLLELAAQVLDRPDLLWGASNGRAGSLPARCAASFPDGGYHIQRSGWGTNGTAFEDERFLVFDCGPLGDGGHGHYDALSVEIACGGGPVAMDPGRYTYAEDQPNMRHWFKGTAAHNTVVVDRLDQTPYRRGKPKGPVAEARFLGRVCAPGIDILCGEVTSPSYDAVHRRRITFVDGWYWIVEDRLSSPSAHRYDLRWHLAPDADGTTRMVRRESDVLILGPRATFVAVGDVVPTVEPGWVSPLYGVLVPAPVVSIAVEGVACSTFLTLIVPNDLAGGAPRAKCASGRPCDDNTTVIEVAHSTGDLDTITLDLREGSWSRIRETEAGS